MTPSICMTIKNFLHISGFALSLALKQRRQYDMFEFGFEFEFEFEFELDFELKFELDFELDFELNF